MKVFNSKVVEKPGDKKPILESNSNGIDYDQLRKLLDQNGLKSDLIDNEIVADRIKNFKKYFDEFLMKEYPDVFRSEEHLKIFYECLKKCHGYISGSIILAVIYDDRSLCNDIDIFVNVSMFNNFMIEKISKNLAESKEKVIPEKLEFKELKEFYPELFKWFWANGFLSEQHIVRKQLKELEQSFNLKKDHNNEGKIIEEDDLELVDTTDHYYEFAKMNDNQYFSVINFNLTNKPYGLLKAVPNSVKKIKNKIPFQVILNIKNMIKSEAYGTEHIKKTIDSFDIDICANYFDGKKLFMKNEKSLTGKWYNYTKTDNKSINVQVSDDGLYRKFYTRNLKYTRRNLVGFCNISNDDEKKQLKEKFAKYLNEKEFEFPMIYNKELDVYLYKLSYYERNIFQTDDLVKNRDKISNVIVKNNIGKIYKLFKKGKKIMLVY